MVWSAMPCYQCPAGQAEAVEPLRVMRAAGRARARAGWAIHVGAPGSNTPCCVLMCEQGLGFCIPWAVHLLCAGHCWSRGGLYAPSLMLRGPTG